jgi:hypothetical protein
MKKRTHPMSSMLTPKMTPLRARADHWSMLGFLAANAAAGAVTGLFVFSCIVWLDAGGIGSLLAKSDNPVLPGMLIAIPMSLTFAAAAAASAIMLMPYQRKFADETDDQ